MGFEAGDNPKYQITSADAGIIKQFQIMKAFSCLDAEVYRRNPAWFNEAAYALIRTENKVTADKIEEQNGRART